MFIRPNTLTSLITIEVLKQNLTTGGEGMKCIVSYGQMKALGRNEQWRSKSAKQPRTNLKRGAFTLHQQPNL